MKKFTFTLELLHGTKRMQEKELRKELADIEARLKEQLLVLSCLQREMAELCYIRQNQMVAGLGPVSLQQFNNSFRQLSDQQKILQEHIRRIDQEKSACQERMIMLLTDLKGLETLKEQQYGQFRQELAKEQENEMGDFVSFHRKQSLSVGG